MDGSVVRFYVDEKQRHGGALVWEWLLQEARRLGVPGGSAFRSIGSFGRHRAVHEDRFFELAGSTGVQVEFIASEEQIAQLLDQVHCAKIRTFYALSSVRFGVINPDAEDSLERATGV